MKISVLVWCFDRQEYLDKTLPGWMAQEGIDFDIIVGHGTKVKVPEHWEKPLIKTTFTEELKINRAYNNIIAASDSDLVLITQCDLQVNSTTQLKRMLDMWKPGLMISERYFDKVYNSKGRMPGLFLHALLVERKAVMDVGGWYEGFDCPTTAAHEDSDLIARLWEHGLKTKFMETPEDEGMFHLDHPRPNYHSDPVMIERIKNGKALYDSRHKEGVMAMYVKQCVVPNLMATNG